MTFDGEFRQFKVHLEWTFDSIRATLGRCVSKIVVKMCCTIRQNVLCFSAGLDPLSLPHLLSVYSQKTKKLPHHLINLLSHMTHAARALFVILTIVLACLCSFVVQKMFTSKFNTYSRSIMTAEKWSRIAIAFKYFCQNFAHIIKLSDHSSHPLCLALLN